jgi:hypothetical protein
MLQARSTVWSSLGLISRPLVVVPSTVTTMRDGPSRTDLSDAPTRLSLELEMDLMLSRGPFWRIATVLA